MEQQFNLSPDLRFALGGLFNQLLMGQLSTPEAVAIAADKISDLAWEEAEKDESGKILSFPPSLRLE